MRGQQHSINNSRHTNANTNPSHDYEHNLEETEIIHIGRKSQNECAVVATIGNGSYKALWDSGAAKCVLSLDCYQSISPNFKTELYESSIKIRAANASFIENRVECNLTYKINDEQFTFPFLCSDKLPQQLILGHNFAKAFHSGTSCDANDTMSLTINGRAFGETIPAKDIQALVFCSEGAIVPTYSNGYILCRLPKLLRHSKSRKEFCL